MIQPYYLQTGDRTFWLTLKFSVQATMNGPNNLHSPRGRPMGWIVKDACTRLRSEIGSYRWDQWRQAADRMGVSVAIVTTGPVPAACLIDDLIIIRGGLDERTTAFLVFHELGHAYLHAGNRDTWAAMPCGTLLMGKMERQANEFAAQFPKWE